MATAAKPATAAVARPLDAEELRILADLQSRAEATGTAPATAGRRTATKAGSTWRALTNLSVPRIGDKERQADLVLAGETVILTDEQARQFLKPVKVVDCIARVSDHEAVNLRPRDLSGPIRVPPARKDLPKGYHGPIADPAGSSFLTINEIAAPEIEGPGTEVDPNMGDDTLDIPPSGAARAAAARHTRTATTGSE